MHISRFAKTVTYLVATALLLALAGWFQVGFHADVGPEEAYFRANTVLFWIAVACLGTAVYSYRAYTRRHREHAVDSLLLLVTGGLLLIAETAVLLLFGGLTTPFGQSGYTATNLQMLLLAVLPLPFFIRTVVLAFGRREISRPAARRGVRIACVTLAIAMAGLLVFGGLLRFVHYEQPSSYIGYTEESTTYA